MCATDCWHSCFRKAEVLDLACPNQVLHRSRHVFDRHIRVNAVLVEQIDGINLEALERSLGDPLDLFWPAVEACQTSLRLGIDFPSELGGDHHLPTERFERFAHQFFVDVRAVGFRYTGYQLDGVQNTDMGNQTSTLTNPGPDVLSEFKVLTSNYSAKYGVAGGANILAVTKTGTKEFHGNLWEFLRNDKLSAADFFLNRAGGQKGKLRYNDYGYTLGGPFYIPGHYNTDKTKTFFFWSQSWAKYREGTTIFNTHTPTLRMRQGDFSECDPASPNFNAIADSGCVLPKNPATGAA